MHINQKASVATGLSSDGLMMGPTFGLVVGCAVWKLLVALITQEVIL